MIFMIILTKRILIINATILILKYKLYTYILIVTLPYIYIQKRHTTKTVIVIKIVKKMSITAMKKGYYNIFCLKKCKSQQ